MRRIFVELLEAELVAERLEVGAVKVAGYVDDGLIAACAAGDDLLEGVDELPDTVALLLGLEFGYVDTYK